MQEYHEQRQTESTKLDDAPADELAIKRGFVHRVLSVESSDHSDPFKYLLVLFDRGQA